MTKVIRSDAHMGQLVSDLTPAKAKQLQRMYKRPAGNVVSLPLKAIIREAEDVQPIDQYLFVTLGGALSRLKDCHEEKPRAAFWKARSSLEKVERLLKGDPIPIKFSRESAEKLKGALEEFLSSLKDIVSSEDSAESDEAIGFGTFFPVYTALEAFDHNLAAELKGCSVYYVPKKGIYDTADLIDRAEMHFPEELHSWIPELSRGEFQEAGRCLAFNLSSACGFHVARAVEALLIDYANAFGAECDAEQDGMGDCLKALQLIKKDEDKPIKPSGKTIRTINDIKDFDRNPLMHPRAVLSEAEARSFFSLGHSAISAMALELRKLGGEEQQKALPFEEDSPVANALAEIGRTAIEDKSNSEDSRGDAKDKKQKSA